MNEYRTIKVWLSTYRMLRMLAARQGLTMVAVLHSLVEAAYSSLEGEK